MLKLNIKYIINYLILFILIALFMYGIDNLSISFDNIHSYHDTFFTQKINSGANNSNYDNFQPTFMPPLSKYDQIRRWLHWRVYGNQKFVTIKEFNNCWRPTDDLKSKFKDEFKEFKKGPVNYLKKDYHETREVMIKRDHIQRDIDKNSMYVEGCGWITRGDLRDLNRNGLTVQDSKIIKIACLRK